MGSMLICYKDHKIVIPVGANVTEDVVSYYHEALVRIDTGEQSAIVLPVGWKYSKEYTLERPL